MLPDNTYARFCLLKMTGFFHVYMHVCGCVFTVPHQVQLSKKEPPHSWPSSVLLLALPLVSPADPDLIRQCCDLEADLFFKLPQVTARCIQGDHPLPVASPHAASLHGPIVSHTPCTASLLLRHWHFSLWSSPWLHPIWDLASPATINQGKKKKFWKCPRA